MRIARDVFKWHHGASTFSRVVVENAYDVPNARVKDDGCIDVVIDRVVLRDHHRGCLLILCDDLGKSVGRMTDVPMPSREDGRWKVSLRSLKTSGTRVISLSMSLCRSRVVAFSISRSDRSKSLRQEHMTLEANSSSSVRASSLLSMFIPGICHFVSRCRPTSSRSTQLRPSAQRRTLTEVAARRGSQRGYRGSGRSRVDPCSCPRSLMSGMAYIQTKIKKVRNLVLLSCL